MTGQIPAAACDGQVLRSHKSTRDLTEPAIDRMFDGRRTCFAVKDCTIARADAVVGVEFVFAGVMLAVLIDAIRLGLVNTTARPLAIRVLSGNSGIEHRRLRHCAFV